jgi:PAS domain-containing protein
MSTVPVGFLPLANAVNELVFVWKPTGEMLWVNRAFESELGMTVEDFGFRNVDNPFIHPADLPAVLESLEAFLTSRAVISGPIANRFFDAWGRMRSIVSVVHKIDWGGEQVLLFVSSFVEDAAPQAYGAD